MQIVVCSGNPRVIAIIEGLFGIEDRITVCESGLELLGTVRAVSSDVVILDLETPGLNSLFLVSAIQELAPQVPIVAVSMQAPADLRALTQKGVTYAALAPDADDGASAALAELVRAACPTHAVEAGSGSSRRIRPVRSVVGAGRHID